MEFFFIYVATVFVAITLFYAISRWIDYAFKKKEDIRRCKMAKSCIRTYTDGQKQMARGMVKAINDNVFEMARKFEDL